MRYLLSQQRRPLSRYQKWLLIARLLDALEHDYRAIYPDDNTTPFPNGFEEEFLHLLRPK